MHPRAVESVPTTGTSMTKSVRPRGRAKTQDAKKLTQCEIVRSALEKLVQSVGWRSEMPGGGWRFAPDPLRIRDMAGDRLWTKHPERDIAVMEISAPPVFARAAIPLGWLASGEDLDSWQVGPGDELLTLGFPRGYSSNTAGFPILRTGRIASWPLTPVASFPVFLLDFPVFPGNSGGPVFWTPAARKLPGTVQPDHPFIAGVLTSEVRPSDEPLGIGVVAHAGYVREAIALLDAAPTVGQGP